MPRSEVDWPNESTSPSSSLNVDSVRNIYLPAITDIMQLVAPSSACLGIYLMLMCSCPSVHLVSAAAGRIFRAVFSQDGKAFGHVCLMSGGFVGGVFLASAEFPAQSFPGRAQTVARHEMEQGRHDG